MRVIGALLIACALAAPAVAQVPSPRAQGVIAALDTDRNGSVSRAEYLAFRLAAAARADRDGTAGLSVEEFRSTLDAAGRRSAESAFNGFNRNQDGVLDTEELTGYHGFVFSSLLDTDRDGSWTAQEYEMLLATDPAMAQPAADDGPAQPEDIFALLDADDSGGVSLNEYLTAQAARFAQFDADQNGRLTLREFEASLDGVARDNASNSYARFDGNRDRRLGRNEFLGYHAWIYQNVLDRNGDGAWTLPEYQALLSRGRRR